MLSPDGKTLAAAAKDNVVLWETASGQVRGRFPGHRAWIWSLSFAAHGRLLASGSQDYTALVWDVTGVCPDGKLSARGFRPNELDRLWGDLAGGNGLQAYRAVWLIVAGARESVAFLEKQLSPEVGVNDERAEPPDRRPGQQ